MDLVQARLVVMVTTTNNMRMSLPLGRCVYPSVLLHPKCTYHIIGKAFQTKAIVFKVTSYDRRVAEL
jgi:hypothetical protein